MFAGAPEGVVEAFAARARVVRLEDGERPCCGSPDFVAVLSGQLEFCGEKLLPGESLGEYEWLRQDAAAARAVGQAEIAILARRDFEEVLENFPAARMMVAHAVQRRMERAGVNQALRRSELLGTLDPGFARDLASELAPVRLHGGQPLFQEGDAGDSVYSVINGRLRVVVKGSSGAETAVAELGRGEMVGEMALMSGQPRAASVWAVRDSYLARLSAGSYRRLLRKHPEEVMRVFGGKVAERLRDANKGRGSPSSRISTLTVVPASPGVPLSAFCEQLARALGKVGKPALISSAEITRRFGDPGLAQTADWDGGFFRVAEWQSRLEHDHDFVVYQADQTLTPWTERCVRQGDQILIAAELKSDPRKGEIESDLLANLPLRTRQKESLALIRNGNLHPYGTAGWLAQREVERVHQVRMDEQSDFDRMARILTNNAVGLALGGGFARGLAHLGAMEALEQMGIHVDAVGGSSMGALIGGLWAQGWSHERIIHEVREGCSDMVGDSTFPFVAFKRGGKFSSLVVRFFEDRQIEDLPVPYFCVSANLNRAEVKMHTSGGMTKAVLASTRAPAVFPPIVYDGELHVDGGVINNVPVDLMRPFVNDGIVIGVDVSPPHELSDVPDYGYDVSGWDALRSRFGILGKKKGYLPSILLVLMRTIEFGGTAFKTARNRYADVYLQPPMLGFKRTDWRQAEKIVEVGRKHTLERMEEWLESPAGARMKSRLRLGE